MRSNKPPNAEIEYIDATPGRVLAVERFYDPGLDPESWLARELKKRGRWSGPHLAYHCGRALSRNYASFARITIPMSAIGDLIAALTTIALLGESD